MKDLGLYLHIPFCRKRCHFCAFSLQIHREDRVQAYLSALESEFALYALDETICRRPVSTVYVGGGTPTVLSPEQLLFIFSLIKKVFSLQTGAEITVEATPDTLTPENLHGFHKLGVTRLSMGAQSFEETEWKRLGRSGCCEMTMASVALAHSSGFQNVNFDLMYGLPGQTLESWWTTLEKAVQLSPTHLSCYALTIEEGTQFSVDRRRGTLEDGNPLMENAMEDFAISFLADAGYQRYEISNYAQSGFHCRHNLRYWQGLDYLGLGPSAQSYVGGIRFGNIGDLGRYGQCLRNGAFPYAEVEALSPRQINRERVVFGLRLMEGLPLQEVNELTLDQHWQATVNRFIQEGILCQTQTSLKLTALGRRFVDSVAVELL